MRAHYDTVFEELAQSKHLEDLGMIRGEIDRHRSIRVYPPNTLTPGKLRDAVKLAREADAAPSLIVLEGLDLAQLTRADVEDLRSLAQELSAEIWLEATSAKERAVAVPPGIQPIEDLISVILALEPGEDVVRLRAIKDHANPDVSDLHVSLDPRSLLLVRS